MTDNKIIEAIDCCRIENCHECPYREYYNCREVLAKDTIDLINRQKAEINELGNKCDDCAGCIQWKCDCANIKAEAIKEFFEKIEEFYSEEVYENFVSSNKVLTFLDNLVKEMTKEK